MSNRSLTSDVDGTAAEIPPLDFAELELLLLLERPRIFSYIKKHFPRELAGVLEPGDVLQDTYFEACKRLGAFSTHDGTSMFRWLVTIARHRIAYLIRMRRSLKRGGEAEKVDLGDNVIQLLGELAMHRRTPSQSMILRELLIALEDAMGKLPEQYRLVITLRYLDELKPQEIAQRLGRTVGAVHQLTHRALEQVRAELRATSHCF